MCEHKGPKIGTPAKVGALGPALPPREEIAEGRTQGMPHLLDILDRNVEGIGKCRLGEACRDAHPQRAGRKLQQRVTAIGVEPVEQRGEQVWRTRTADRRKCFNDRVKAERLIAMLRPLPEQRNGLSRVADIVAAHAEQRGIEARVGHCPDL